MSVPKQQKEPVGWLWVAAAFFVAVLVTQLLLERGANPYFRGTGIACLLLSPIFMLPQTTGRT